MTTRQQQQHRQKAMLTNHVIYVSSKTLQVNVEAQRHLDQPQTYQQREDLPPQPQTAEACHEIHS